MKVKIALVLSEFNYDVTSKMLEKALEYAKLLDAEVRYIFKVPGSYEIPLAVKLLAEKEDVDSIVTLGAIIKGETKHDEVIAHSVTKTLLELALKYNKPVTLGISGPGMSEEQAYARIDEYAKRSVEAAVKLYKRIVKFRNLETSKFPQLID
ncbi:6,7-dimethyl-8-ribityllumazine synthase [archaeon HR06]|nr:6,7-dimethyl-8-ribityllumazine synthase [archaeon HR06]